MALERLPLMTDTTSASTAPVVAGEALPAFDEAAARAAALEMPDTPPVDVPVSWASLVPFTPTRDSLSPEDRDAVCARLAQHPVHAHDTLEPQFIREALEARAAPFRRLRTLQAGSEVAKEVGEIEAEFDRLKRLRDAAYLDMTRVADYTSRPDENGVPQSVPVMALPPEVIQGRANLVADLERQMRLIGPGGIESTKRLKEAEDRAVEQARQLHQQRVEQAEIERLAREIASKTRIHEAASKRAKMLKNTL